MATPQAQPAIVVVGSVNMDLVARAPGIPRPGQTVLGHDFATYPGGKGANQAVAAARLGATVALIARVGEDAFGRTLREGLVAAGVDCSAVRRTLVATGVALITVADDGENAICVAGGANLQLSPADIDAAEVLFAGARCCVLQLEIPLETAVRAVAMARRHGLEVILDPAPARADLPTDLLGVDVLTPNESEAATILGLDFGGAGDAESLAERLLGRGARAVVLKCGARGAYVGSAAERGWLAGRKVAVVDTTAAGDAFTAALAVARVDGRGLLESARFANAAGALACMKPGAQPSLPARVAVEALLGGG